jgi:hypothetical protein
MSDQTICAHCQHYSGRDDRTLVYAFGPPLPPPNRCLARPENTNLVTGIISYADCFVVNDGACKLYEDAPPQPTPTTFETVESATIHRYHLTKTGVLEGGAILGDDKIPLNRIQWFPRVWRNFWRWFNY